MYKIELHAHTFPGSCDSRMLPTTLVSEAHQKGYHGIVISNHLDVGQIAKMQTGGYGMCAHECDVCPNGIPDMTYDVSNYKALYEKWFIDLKRAQLKGEQLGVKVYAGCEYTVRNVDAHIAILGLTVDEFLEAEFMPEEDIYYLQLFREKYPDMLLVQNHPDRNRVIYLPTLVDAYERFNTKHIDYKGCDSAYQLAERLDKRVFKDFLFVCGGDIHESNDLGVSYMDFDTLPEDEHELVKEIRKRNYKIHIEVRHEG